MINVSGDFSSFKDLADAVDKADKVAFNCMRRAYFAIGEQYRTFHRLKRLRGRPGLNLNSGNAGMAGSSQTVVVGDDMDSLTASTFWGPPASKYVRTHEYGATIRPKTANYLRFRINGKWISTKEVTIPKRLGWFDTWDEFDAKRQRILNRCIAEITGELAS